jgi:hypothetical protein
MEAPSHLYGEIDDMELDTFQVRVRERHELGGFDSSTELRSLVDEVSRKELNHRRTRAYADDMSTIFDFYDRFRRLIVHVRSCCLPELTLYFKNNSFAALRRHQKSYQKMQPFRF